MRRLKFILVPSPIWFHANKHDDGLYYDVSNSASLSQNINSLMSEALEEDAMIEIEEFLNDQTANSTDKQCIAIFVDPLDFQNISLKAMDCSSKALVFCEIEPDYEEHFSDAELRSVPCIPPSNRYERSTDAEIGKIV